MRKAPHPEKHLERIESKRDVRTYIFYGGIGVLILAVIAIIIIAAIQGGGEVRG
jgi:hypothetical protein